MKFYIFGNKKFAAKLMEQNIDKQLLQNTELKLGKTLCLQLTGLLFQTEKYILLLRTFKNNENNLNNFTLYITWSTFHF